MSADVVCPARSPLFRPPRELEFGSERKRDHSPAKNEYWAEVKGTTLSLP